MRHVVVPQAVRRVIPPLLNDFIGLQKDTALISVLGVLDVVNRAGSSTTHVQPSPRIRWRRCLFLLVTIPLTRWLDRLIAPPAGQDAGRAADAWRSSSSATCTRRFGTNQVLRGIDLDVEQHQVVCLIGASGCGKSTLLRCINAAGDDRRRRRSTSTATGSADAGVDVDALRRDVGIVFQSFNLFPHMTVLRERDAGARSRCSGFTKDVGRGARHALLKRIGLDEKAKEYPDRLSGGQQQRVAIVRALAMEPTAAAARRDHLGARPRAGRRGAQHRPRPGRDGHDDDAGHPRDGLRQGGRRRRCASCTRA